ncbi:MAG: hypothetical protein ABSA76_13770 [Bacteroidales bacterium]
MKNFIDKIKRFFRPIVNSKPMVKDVLYNYVIVIYHGQKINLRISELPNFSAMSRKDKRGMAQRFASMEKNGLIRFEKIDNKWICIKNKNYAEKANIK